MGRFRGFIERDFVKNKIVRKTPASAIWRLWRDDSDEFGTFEVREIRPGWSITTFSGLGSQGLLSDKEWKIKTDHMQNIIESYYFMLSQEDIISYDTTQHQLHFLTGKEKKRDIKIVKQWCSGASGGDIAGDCCLGRATVYNIISKLRKKYPLAKIPRDEERKPMKL
jgi:hypothetical protein